MGWITNLDKEPLDFRYLNKECTKAVLQQPLVYDYNGLKIEVPEGFTCDGASIPKTSGGHVDTALRSSDNILSVCYEGKSNAAFY